MSHINKHIGKPEPIVVELTYEDWRRLSRLRNHHSEWDHGAEWLCQFYDAVLKRAGLKSLNDQVESGHKFAIQEIVLGYRAYAKYQKIMLKKYGKHDKPWIDFQSGPSEVLQPDDPPITPDQILIRPYAFGIQLWSPDVFR